MIYLAKAQECREGAAIDDLTALIRRRYPQAIFAVTHGDDPEGIYLKAIIDVDDVDEVLDQEMLDRLFTLQVEQELPLYLIPLQPTHRVLAFLAANRTTSEALASRPALTFWHGRGGRLR